MFYSCKFGSNSPTRSWDTLHTRKCHWQDPLVQRLNKRTTIELHSLVALWNDAQNNSLIYLAKYWCFTPKKGLQNNVSVICHMTLTLFCNPFFSIWWIEFNICAPVLNLLWKSKKCSAKSGILSLFLNWLNKFNNTWIAMSDQPYILKKSEIMLCVNILQCLQMYHAKSRKTFYTVCYDFRTCVSLMQ